MRTHQVVIACLAICVALALQTAAIRDIKAGPRSDAALTSMKIHTPDTTIHTRHLLQQKSQCYVFASYDPFKFSCVGMAGGPRGACCSTNPDICKYSGSAVPQCMQDAYGNQPACCP